MKRWLVIGALTVALAGCGPEEGVPFNPNAASILRDAFAAFASKAPQDEAALGAIITASS